uniref:S-layer homology domain-containing protein n=1 Tax=Collinsella sp. BA40 TaxID=2560852 RepID=UPI001C9D07C7|nr:S-layer homology domain-containing protein [Collinsella sp. BA40]
MSDQWEPAEQVEAKALDQLKDSYADIADTEAVSAPKMLSKNDARLGGSYPVQDGVTKWVSVDRNTLFTDFTFTIRRSTVVRFAARTTSYRSSASFMIQNEHDQGCIIGLAKYGLDMEAFPVALPAGTYTVTALISTDYSGSLGFVYETVPGMDKYADQYAYEYEDNGSIEDATPLAAHNGALGFLYNAALSGTTQEIADLDYYKFTLSKPGSVRVMLAGLPGIMYALENVRGDILHFGLDPNENALVGQTPYYGGSLDETTATFFETGVLPAGTYYIVVVSDLPRVAGSPYIVGYEVTPSIFMDVTANTPHLEHINWLANAGISKGWREPNGYTFRPFANVARADMAAFLYRLVGSPEYTPSAAERAKFRDVDSSTPHAKEIWWLASTGISAGWNMGNGVYEFRPYAEVTRCDMAAFLYRLAGSPAFEPNASERAAFRDVNASTPHANEIFWLASSGISTGWNESDGSKTFRPYNIVVRCDMSAFLHRMSDYGLLPAE